MFLNLGVKTRTPYCIEFDNQQPVDNKLCDENNATKPELEKPCTTTDCEAELVYVFIFFKYF